MKYDIKKWVIVPIVSLILFISVITVEASGFSISSSSGSVSLGARFNVSLNLSGEGKFKVTVNNGSASVSEFWYPDVRSFSVSAGNQGTVNVTVTAVDVAGYDERPITGSRSLS